MPDFQCRSSAAIDADLRALSATRRDARRELTEVRRRQKELVDLEAELVGTIDVRSRRIDDVLDERLRVGVAAMARPETLPLVEEATLPSFR